MRSRRTGRNHSRQPVVVIQDGGPGEEGLWADLPVSAGLAG